MPVAREPESGTSVKTSLTLIVIGGVAVGTVAAFVVPWQWLPDAHLWRGATTPWISTARRSDIEAFAEVRRYLGWANYALVLLALGWCALTRAGSRLMSWLPGPWPVRTALGAVSITLATTLISLPIAWWQHTRALHVGLSTQSATAWFRDLALSWLIDAATTALILVLVVGFARRWPRRWPLPIAACVAAATLALSMAYPLLIEPLFNRFTPLPQGPLRSAITELAERQGVRIREVLVADASRRTTALNAYVSGIGGTRRVVLYDTLVSDLPPDQAQVVVAHELAHARNHDVAWGTALGAVGSIIGVGVLGLLLSRRGLLARGGANAAGDPRVVPLVIFLIAAGSFAVSPVQNVVSRAMEARADVESLQATSDFEGFRRMQAALCDKSWCDPAPPALAQFWFGSHPTTQERIGLANDLEGK